MNSAPGGLSRRAYARHRGCDESAVRQAIREGRCPVLPDGTIDPVAADAAWPRRSVASGPAGRPERQAGLPFDAAPSVRTSVAEPTPASDGDGVGTRDYWIAKTREQQQKAEQATMKTAQMRGELVPVADVERQWFSRARVTRDRVLAVPGKCVALMRAAADEHAARRLLENLLREALVPRAGDDELSAGVESPEAA